MLDWLRAQQVTELALTIDYHNDEYLIDDVAVTCAEPVSADVTQAVVDAMPAYHRLLIHDADGTGTFSLVVDQITPAQPLFAPRDNQIWFR